MYTSDAILYSQEGRIEETALDISIEQFLLLVEKKAYRIAEIATQNQSDALDIVQDTMIKLVEKYSDKPSNEWKPLFYTILNSRIMDYFRRKKVYNSLFFWKKQHLEDEGFEDEISKASDFITPERELQGQQDVQKVSYALKQLSPRQQQCFLRQEL